jgi:hypothetical protein
MERWSIFDPTISRAVRFHVCILLLTRATIGDNGDARGCSNINRQIDLGTALVGLRDLSICHQEEA